MTSKQTTKPTSRNGNGSILVDRTAFAKGKMFRRGNDGRRPTGVAPVMASVGPPAARRADASVAQPDAVPSEVSVARVEQVLARNRQWLEGLPGVLGVRRGYKVTRGWISTTPCIVVTVRRKASNTPLEIPDQIEDVLVDVAPATPAEQLLALPAAAKRQITLSRALGTEEIVRTSRYLPPPHLRLDPVEGAMTVLCHSSPDAGWPTLRRFLRGTTQRLTVGMYDFTAPHIRRQMAASMKDVAGDLQLVLDPKLALGSPGNGQNPKADDETEDVVKDELDEALKDRLRFVWAAVKLEGKTTKGIFPSAYHIKVVVRDGLDFMLSSGNFQSSNQPDLEPLDGHVDGSSVLKVFNREWHVIVAHRGLAQVLEQYLEWDFEQAAPLQVQPEIAVLPELAVPPVPEEAEAEVEPRFFEPREFRFTADRPLRIQPLLSPDNYAEHTLELVRSARRKLYIQNQYIKIARENAGEFMAILAAVKKAMNDGVDVKIIVRDLPDTRAQLEALQDYGFSMDCVKTLRSTHTKGVIVDSKTVMVGSHNWSNDGVLYNRDASLIFYDPQIASFYETLFLYDWTRAAHLLTFELGMPIVVGGEEAAPIGYRTARWTDVYEGSPD